MNNDRRKAIKALYPQCTDVMKLAEAAKEAIAKYKAAAEELKGDIETIRDEEQDYIDNLPENLQQSERAQVAAAAVENLENAINALDDDDIENFDVSDVESYLDSAAE